MVRITTAGALILLLGQAPLAAQPMPALEAICLCASGHVPGNYSAQIAVTDANRDELRQRIESGAIWLRQTISLNGGACPARPWNPTPGCGRSSMQVTNAQGVSETRMADDVVTTGTRRLRISSVGGVPRASDAPPGTVRVDAERWARVQVMTLIGTAQP